MARPTFFLVLFSVCVVFSNLFFVSFKGGNFLLNLVGNSISIAVALFAFLACWFVYRKISPIFKSERRVWFFSALAFSFFLLGELYWGYFEVIKGIDVPIGSLADVFWFSGYLSWFVAIYYLLSLSFFSSKEIYVFAGVVAVSAAVYFVVFLNHILDGIGPLLFFVQSFYVLFDIVLIGMISVVVLPMIFSRNSLLTAWLLFGCCVFVRVVFDFVFFELVHSGTYYTGHPIDILYSLSFVCVVFAADFKYKLLEGRK